MNVLFFLTPKKDVAYIYNDFTIRQTLEKMEYHKFSAVPIIDRDGKYVATITEGDLLWYMKAHKDADIEHICVSEVNRKFTNLPINAFAQIDNLMERAVQMNFVPVVDDNNIFIGIVTRKAIMKRMYDIIKENKLIEKK